MHCLESKEASRASTPILEESKMNSAALELRQLICWITYYALIQESGFQLTRLLSMITSIPIRCQRNLIVFRIMMRVMNTTGESKSWLRRRQLRNDATKWRIPESVVRLLHNTMVQTVALAAIAQVFIPRHTMAGLTLVLQTDLEARIQFLDGPTNSPYVNTCIIVQRLETCALSCLYTGLKPAVSIAYIQSPGLMAMSSVENHSSCFSKTKHADTQYYDCKRCGNSCNKSKGIWVVFEVCCQIHSKETGNK